MANNSNVQSEFTSYYLQQAAKEFSEDLDKVRSADDFKGDALPTLIKALQQGASLFSSADQQRIVEAGRARSDQADEVEDASTSSDSSGSSDGGNDFQG